MMHTTKILFPAVLGVLGLVGCSERIAFDFDGDAYQHGVLAASTRSEARITNCAEFYHAPDVTAETAVITMSVNREAVEEARSYYSCRIANLAVMHGHSLRHDSLDVSLCQSTVDHAVARDLPWVSLTATQHQLVTSTCEDAFNGDL